MRNPLSAILQSSDSIMDILNGTPSHVNGDVILPAQALEAILEAAKTINLCGQHQKIIVDDVLTVRFCSRLFQLFH